jgi:Zn-dependent M16 (insulinase) family peptidase
MWMFDVTRLLQLELTVALFRVCVCGRYEMLTTNNSDLCNMMQVYLDVCFFPLLPKALLQPYKQKQIEQEQDNVSDGMWCFLHVLHTCIFPSPSNPFHWNAMGDPQQIATITHQQLRDFHRQHYSIDNALFLSYGDMDPTPQLQII